ncbi:hypothetical protein MRB53_032521 [Persea americana]|uniref:Uncharacterized protein n=1 Tax=Persea americana TaxID=3435 RepID=A0ACC2KT08_PERAE|nr:hypothetical protein MRB53_032521 [Persea americana]
METRIQTVVYDNPPLECGACKRLQLQSSTCIYYNHAPTKEPTPNPTDKGKEKVIDSKSTSPEGEWQEVARRRRGRQTSSSHEPGPLRIHQAKTRSRSPSGTLIEPRGNKLLPKPMQLSHPRHAQGNNHAAHTPSPTTNPRESRSVLSNHLDVPSKTSSHQSECHPMHDPQDIATCHPTSLPQTTDRTTLARTPNQEQDGDTTTKGDAMSGTQIIQDQSQCNTPPPVPSQPACRTIENTYIHHPPQNYSHPLPPSSLASQHVSLTSPKLGHFGHAQPVRQQQAPRSLSHQRQPHLL